jgi:hypothetical protein
MQQFHVTLGSWADSSDRHSPRENSLKTFPQNSRTKLVSNTFTIRATKLWNDLAGYVEAASSVCSFKNRLDKYWSKQEVYYGNYKAPVGSDVREHPMEHGDEASYAEARMKRITILLA